MAHISFEKEPGTAFDDLIEVVVEAINQRLQTFLVGHDVVKEFSIERVTFGDKPPYMEITRVCSAKEFPRGLIPRKMDRPQAKLYEINVTEGKTGVPDVSCTAKTLKGETPSWGSVLQSLPLYRKPQQPLKETPERNTADEEEDAYDDDVVDFASTLSEEAMHAMQDVKGAEGEPDADVTPPPLPLPLQENSTSTKRDTLEKPTTSPASVCSRSGNNNFFASTRSASGFWVPQLFFDDPEVDDESDSLPGFREAMGRHLVSLLPDDVTSLCGPEGVWIEFIFSYAGDMEFVLSASFKKSLELEGMALPDFFSLPMLCRGHSIRVQAAVQILVCDGALQVYVIPETPAQDFWSCVSFEFECMCADHPFPEASEKLTELLRSIATELLANNVLWPNSLRLPLENATELLKRILTHWAVRNAQAR